MPGGEAKKLGYFENFWKRNTFKEFTERSLEELKTFQNDYLNEFRKRATEEMCEEILKVIPNGIPGRMSQNPYEFP